MVKTVVGELQPLEGKQLGPTVVIHLAVSVDDSASNPYPGGLWAHKSASYSVEADGSLSRRLADVRIQRTRVNDRGRLVVGLSYECSPGYDADVDDRSDWADITVSQDRGPNRVWEHYDWTLADDVVCDGTRHAIVRRFAPRSPEGPMRSTRPVNVVGRIGANEDARTSWPH